MKQFNSLLELTKHFSTEESCIQYFSNIRWKNGLFCPHCNNSKKAIYRFSDNKRYKCGACLSQFTVRVGTIFEDSKLPLQKWLIAFWLVTNHKKGVSSLQLSRDISVTQKTAWFMLQRIQFLAQSKSLDKPLGNTVEIDETYVGGKEINKHQNKRTMEYNKVQGDKVPMLGMIQKDGDIKLKQFAKVNKANIKPIIDKYVSSDAIIHTDESPIYKGALDKRKHEVVNHKERQYVKCNVTTNRIEGSFAHFKRTINGMHHWVSKKHIQRYADMFSYRWNTRSLDIEVRLENIISLIENTQLTYKQLKS